MGSFLSLSCIKSNSRKKHRPLPPEPDLVPKFIYYDNNIVFEPYYFGNISRYEAEELLFLPETLHGAFILRDTFNTRHKYSISVCFCDGVKHFRIQQSIDGRYDVIRRKTFSTLHELIQYYVKTALLKPYVQPHVEQEAEHSSSTSKRGESSSKIDYDPHVEQEAEHSSSTSKRGESSSKIDYDIPVVEQESEQLSSKQSDHPFPVGSPTQRESSSKIDNVVKKRVNNDYIPHSFVPQWKCMLKPLRKLGPGQFGLWKNIAPVAIKALKISKLSKMQTMKMLSNTKLIQLYAVLNMEEPIYIITELMKNGSLFDFLQGKGLSLKLQQSMYISVQKGSGIYHLEYNNYIHHTLVSRYHHIEKNSIVKIKYYCIYKGIGGTITIIYDYIT